jgi:hypothetical protein
VAAFTMLSSWAMRASRSATTACARAIREFLYMSVLVK